MTFSQLTKEEIQKGVKHLEQCCTDAFLYAVFKALGSFSIINKTLVMCVTTENNDLLHFIQKLALDRFGTHSKIQSENTNSIRGSVIYQEIFDQYITQYFGFTYLDNDNLMQICHDTNTHFFDKQCCTKTMLQALMLCCGSISVPTVSVDLTESCSTVRYHMEFVLNDEQFADFVLNKLNQLGFAFKKTIRKHSTVLYLKDSSAIADMLVYLGGYQAKMQLENVIIERSIRNNVNRQSNCISANIDKVVESSRKQTVAIEQLLNSGKLTTLSPQLQQVAQLRLQNPEATLQELATMSGITKSGIRHRMDKLIELSQEI